MTPDHCFKSRSLILATVLVCGLGLFTHANAQTRPTYRPYLVDLNSRSATEIALGGASGINDAGQVVGGSSTAEGDLHAFITGPNGIGMRDLGTSRDWSSAYGINDAG